MAKYLKPLKMFEEGLKRTQYESTVFLGLKFSDKFVSLAISDDCYHDATPYGHLHRDKRMLDNLVDEVQNCVKMYDLEGIITANNIPVASPVNIHNLMDDLYKKGIFKSLKYTCWKDNITSRRAEFVMPSPVYNSPPGVFHSPRNFVEMFSSIHMLQTNLDFFNALVGRERCPDMEEEDFE